MQEDKEEKAERRVSSFVRELERVVALPERNRREKRAKQKALRVLEHRGTVAMQREQRSKS